MCIRDRPVPLPPLQSGVGGVANAVLAGLKASDFTDLKVYSEVLQDAVFDLIDAGKISFASGTSLTVSPDFEEHYKANFENYRDKIMLRPQEISNHPEVIRRLGVIAMNTAIEADIFGKMCIRDRSYPERSLPRSFLYLHLPLLSLRIRRSPYASSIKNKVCVYFNKL